MDNVLQGKSALVVGGTSGIGYCLVQSLLQEFVSVVVQGQSKSKRITSLCGQGNISAICKKALMWKSYANMPMLPTSCAFLMVPFCKSRLI